MRRRLAVLVGFLGKSPVAGMTLYNLHYLMGLQALGYEVHYAERQNSVHDCYDPTSSTMTADSRFAVRYLHEVLPAMAGLRSDQFSFIDLDGCCHGAGWPALRAALDTADFVLTVADPTWFEELERCPRRAFLDGDPMFTQIDVAEGDNPKAEAVAHHDVLFTYATRIGEPDCSVPRAGREWIPTRPVVSTQFWPVAPGDGNGAITGLLHWGAWRDYTFQRRTYGHKGTEVKRFAELPRHSDHRFTLAVGGADAPRDELRRLGWCVEEAGEVTRTVDEYRQFIARSRADLGIAKHAYVASRCGWFSDRSTCFLASGRPVLHQDTGFTDWLPTGEGVLAFSDTRELLDALATLDADYPRHAAAARRLAVKHFDAPLVIGEMLDRAGYR